MFSAAGKTAAAVSTAANYIEDVFSTWLYTGNGSTQTITNGIDLSTKGGLVWIKNRTSADPNTVTDTVRGAGNQLFTNTTDANNSTGSDGTSFTSSGFSVGLNNEINRSGSAFVSWTFREQPKFFDVVTYTGNGTAGRTVAHSLGSVPGCIIIKQTSASGQGWPVYHRSEGSGRALLLNDTAASFLASGYWSNTTPTSTQFTLGSSAAVNENGQTYVAYLFAHDAGGFGLTGTDNVISCGSTDGVSTVNLGYEPQWVLVKASSSTGGWYLIDNMRGWTVPGGDQQWLFANNSSSEGTYTNYGGLNSTGFSLNISAGVTYIYIAIRRGPMKTPTTGTSVFSPNTYTGNSSTQNITTNFPVDFFLNRNRFSAGLDTTATDRLRGFGTSTPYLFTNSTAAEGSASNAVVAMPNTTLNMGSWSQINFSSESYVGWNFQRAPGFFDVVCWTGNDVAGRNLSHNLGVAPEFIITKTRDGTYNWMTWHSVFANTNLVYLNTSDQRQNVSPSSSVLNTNGTSYVAPTASVFTVGLAASINNSSFSYVAYLFASCPGVSKVFSFTGNGSSQTINCGFTGGSRLVLIKRTDSTGNWVIFDSARGIVSGNDPALYLNSTAAEVTGVDAIDTDSTGFIVNQETTFNLNVNNATYIGLAIS